MTILAQTGVFSWALQSGKYGSGTLTAVKAVGQLVYTAQPALNDTITIGTQTYTYKTVLSTGPTVANEIFRGVDMAASIANTVLAIQAGAGIGTNYSTGTLANTSGDAVSAYNTVFLTADTAGSAGNLLALTKSSTAITVVPFSGGQTAGAFNLTTLAWSRHRAADIDYDAVQDNRIFALEVGGVITPTGAYKGGAFVAGGATILPRLEDKFGELLLAMMGSATVAANTPVTGAYTHNFQFNPNALEDIPWIMVRKHIPGRGTVRPQGVVGIDNKMALLRVMIPQNDVVAARVDFVGRIPTFENYSDAWTYAADYENADKAVISCRGHFKLPTLFTTEMPVTSVVVEMVNAVTTPREEMVVGSYNPDDFVVRTRSMVIRFVHKWSDPEMYQRAFTNSIAGTTWSPSPFITNYSAGNYAFEARVESAKEFIGTTPYSLTIRAASVFWEPVGPVRLQGGGVLSLEYRGTVLQPDASTGIPYCELLLVNARTTAYAVPPQT